MILCDIGNTNATFLQDGKISRTSLAEFEPKDGETVYFISVNDTINQRLERYENFINLEPYFELDTIYKGLGIDRIAGCYGVSDGVVVDAGSAITVDVMSAGMHLGGYILPGIKAQLQAYAAISPRLNITINTSVILDALPQKTADAVSYGILKPFVELLNSVAGERKIYFTGGDGEYLARFFKNAICDKMLVFRGMQKIINQKGLK